MKDEKTTPPKTHAQVSLAFAAALMTILLLLALATWYPFAPDSGSAPGELANTDPPTVQLPEEELEPVSGRTPTPGFFDDFEDGLDPVWDVHYGDALTVNGQLTSTVGAGIAAGDETWIDYQIDFAVDTSQVDCAFTDSSNSLGVRVDTFDYAYYFVFSSCEAAWSRYPGGIYQGQESLVPETRSSLASVAVKQLSIKVQGAVLSAYEDGILLSSFEDSSLESGGIFLQLEAQTFYDNFRVTLLP